MRKQELSAWTLIVAASVLGSITAVALVGCQPPTPLTPDTSTSLETAGQETVSSVTAEPASLPAADKATVEAGSPAADTNETVVPEVAIEPAGNAETLVVAAQPASDALVSEAVPPKSVLETGGDWPQWGGTRERNNVPGVKDLPLSWNIGKFDRRTGEWDKSGVQNVLWYADLGSQTYGNPVIADGQVYVGTNNGAGHVKRYPSAVDLGCLLAFDEQSGEFLWQHSSEKLSTGRVHDWPLQGLCCAPLVEGERLWFVTSRGEVRCLDTKGFHDSEDDGPVKDEAAFVAEILNSGPTVAAHAEALQSLAAGKLSDAALAALEKAGEMVAGDVQVEMVSDGSVWKATGNFAGVDRELVIRQIGPSISFFKALGINDKRDADLIWVYDMMGPDMGVSQHNMCSCSVTSYGDLLFVNTSNGLDESHIDLPAPDAPSFICMDKNTGEVIWRDRSPGMNILHGQWSSPAVGVFDGVPQVLFAGGDGILYGFRADRGSDGKPQLLWKFDCNPKTSKWVPGGEGTRNHLIATPVVYDGLVYIAVGEDPEYGEGEGHLWCIDPNKRGDISPTLAMKVEDGKQVPIPHKRVQAVESEKGEVEVNNPNSGAIWHYSMFDRNGDQEIDFEEQMHRTIGTCAVKDDLVYVADLSGLIHCLDAKGSKDGKPIVHFTYDMLAQSWGSPLIADGHVFIGDEDGDVSIFELGAEHKEPIEEISMGSSVYTTPVAANDKLFISSKDRLFAIGQSQ
jgi:outer membrane protein assembly factor BamB